MIEGKSNKGKLTNSHIRNIKRLKKNISLQDDPGPSTIHVPTSSNSSSE